MTKYPIEKMAAIIEELFKNGRNATVTVTGHSMSPMLYNNRSSVVLKKADPDKIKKSDVIFYKRRNGEYVLHRVVKLNDGTVNCCGDNETTVERAVKKENIIGVVIAFRRKGNLIGCNNFFYKIYCVLWVALLKQRRRIMKLNKKLRGKKQ